MGQHPPPPGNATCISECVANKNPSLSYKKVEKFVFLQMMNFWGFLALVLEYYMHTRHWLLSFKSCIELKVGKDSHIESILSLSLVWFPNRLKVDPCVARRRNHKS